MRSLMVLVALAGTASAGVPAARIGDQVPELRFKDIRHLSRSLADFGERKAYVLVFVQSGCPLAEKYLPVLNRLERTYAPKGVQFAAVNSGPADTVTVMAGQAIDSGVGFPFLKDAECRVADALGASRTPEAVVLDAGRVLRYRGRIDDQYRPGGHRASPTRRDLAEALDEVLAGRRVTLATTPVDGCLLSRPASVDEPVTFAGQVAPILRKHCQRCHQPDTAAPFSLLTYDQVKAKARTVAEVVNEGRMPPWFAAPRAITFNTRACRTRSGKRSCAGSRPEWPAGTTANCHRRRTRCRPGGGLASRTWS